MILVRGKVIEFLPIGQLKIISVNCYISVTVIAENCAQIKYENGSKFMGSIVSRVGMSFVFCDESVLSCRMQKMKKEMFQLEPLPATTMRQLEITIVVTPYCVLFIWASRT